MLVIETVQDFKNWRRNEKGKLALIPTMGALHEGHLSLIRKAKTIADKAVLYIFVNPMQFGPKEDFGTYPRTPGKDIEACQKEGIDAVFMPALSEIYPEGKAECTKIVPPTALADILEGHFRPGFFTGVATVLVKFFSIVQPDAVVFGEKDYQQLLVVRRFVKDLNLPITVYGAHTMREPDGLALSSRNIYLSQEQRALAPRIHELLQETAKQIEPRTGIQAASDIETILAKTRQSFADHKIELQYLEAKDASSLQPISKETNKIVLLVAAKIGHIRLIDNLTI